MLNSSYAQFQEHWEQEAGKERERYDARPVIELLADIRAGHFGSYYQIWYSLGSRATLAEAGSLLFSILESSADYLVRYHCAAALISVAGVYADGYRPEQLSAHQTQRVAEHLAALREKIQVGGI
jgi:hypothetical protein